VLSLWLNRGDVLEVFEGLRDIHLEDLGDALFAIHDLQRFAIKAMAAAGRGK